MSDEWVATQGYFSIECRACGVERRTPVMRADDAWRKRDGFEREARAGGWRLFVGRSRYWYCPHHEPSEKNKVTWYEVTR